MSMTMCEDRHDPVVYTEYDHRNKYHKCPVCEALDRVSELEDINKELHDEIKGLKGE